MPPSRSTKLTPCAPVSPRALQRSKNPSTFAHSPPIACISPSWFTLPVTALFHEGREPAVWVVRAADNTLELRRVTVTRYYERTFIVSDGLKDGESVVLQGVHTVSAGQKVRTIAPLHPEDFAS